MPFGGYLPGRTVTYMDWLIRSHNQTTAVSLTNELAMAICWEEGLFNNGKQDGGTALGFGQTEPAELQRLKKAGAINVDITKVKARDDQEAMEAMLQMLDYYIRRTPQNRREALKSYAGYNYKNTAEWHKNRNKIMDGWEACESALLDIPSYDDDPDATVAALKLARQFDPNHTVGGIRMIDMLF